MTRHFENSVYIALCLFFFTSCLSTPKADIRIATAANVQFAMKELTEEFEAETGITTQIVLSSSGKLTAQIQEGAPYDVFVSANMKYPHVLFEKNLTSTKPTVYAYGQLVLWTAHDETTPSLSVLNTDTIQHIAIANPRTAPYGEAALSVLSILPNNIESKLVYGESIAQTNQFILAKAADIGFTAKSVVLSETLIHTGKYIDIPDSLHQPIEQGIVLLLQKGKVNPKAQQFYDFMFSEKAKGILVKYGYKI